MDCLVFGNSLFAIAVVQDWDLSESVILRSIFISINNVAISWHIGDRWKSRLTAVWQDFREKKHFWILTKYHLRFLKSGCTMLIHQSPPYEGTINNIFFLNPHRRCARILDQCGQFLLWEGRRGSRWLGWLSLLGKSLSKKCFNISIFHFHFHLYILCCISENKPSKSKATMA